MSKMILVPIDVADSKGGAVALALAKEHAAAHGSKITLLTVRETVPGYVTASLPAGFEDNIRSEIHARLEAIADEAGVKGSAQLMMRDGAPATVILEVAQEIGAELIVIKSHDPGLSDYLLGSTAARVVRHAHCSVLVVREPRG